jgi:hypothetical protein
MPSQPAHRLIKVEMVCLGANRSIRERRGVFGGGTTGTSNAISREPRRESGIVVDGSSLPQRARHVGAISVPEVRVSVRAMKRSNVRGAKGHRKIDG